MKKRLTVGLFMDSYFPMIDGVTMVMDNYAKRLGKYGDVIVFVPDISKGTFDDSKLGYKVVRCKCVKMPILDYSFPLPHIDREFMKEIEQYKLDIVHIHSPFVMGRLGIKYAQKHKIPVVGTMHSQFKQDFKRAVKSDHLASGLNKVPIHEFNKCDECWAVNKEVARIFYEDYHCKTMPRVMNNSTEMLPLPDPKAADERINKLHGIAEDEKVLLFVGRINKLKNIFFIIDSLKVINEKYPDFKYKMLFVGSGQDEEELKEMIHKNHMEDKVIMVGRVTDRELLASYYKRANLFLFPSLYDASSIVQIEAASQKTPTMFLKGAATASTVTDRVNGYLSENDPEIYARDIVNIFKDEKAYNELCENAFRDLYKNWDDTVKEVYERYQYLYEKKQRENAEKEERKQRRKKLEK